MTVSTAGISLPGGSRRTQAAVELLSSMRFAISLLTLICIASVIGTVLKQHEPLNNYINQFGPFWSQVFGALNLYAVYSAWWFMLILAFLVTSTTLCIVRNTPKILADLRGMLPALTKKLARRGIPGVFVDLEPHVRGGGQFGGTSGPDGMGIAVRALCRVLDKAKLGYHLRDFDDLLAARGL